MQNSIFRLAVASLIVVVALGCARSADSTDNGPTIPDSPDGAVFAAVEAVRDDRVEDIWKFLIPESYKSDISEITSTFAEKMDPAVYDQVFAVVMRAIEVLDDRKDIILASETFKSTGADADEIREGLSNTQFFTDTLKSSQIATLEGLGSADWEQFLATTGNALIKHAKTMEAEDGDNPLGDLDSLKVETVAITGDRATLRISSDNHPPEDVEMVKVEGRWVPAEMAEEWDEGMEEARQSLAEMTPETMAAQKTQIMMFVGMASGLIEQIASLQTPEEFDAAIGPMLAPFLGGMSMDMVEDEEWEMEKEPVEE